jgi:2-dehydrotetronate isomerase
LRCLAYSPVKPMPQFAANLSMLYQEYAFLDRFEAAAQDGFRAVEFLFPYAFAKEDIAARLHTHGLEQVLFNAPPGDWDAGERGIASLPGRESEFRAGMVQALEYAAALDCPRIHAMAGLIPDGATAQALYPTYIGNLRWAAREAAKTGREVLIEPINPRDMPGYYLNRQDMAHQVVADVGEPNLKVQMDLYHCQIVEGDLAMKLRKYLSTGKVAHLQIAGVPQRHEPDVGEVNYSYLFALLDELGYRGWVGCEYRPADTHAGGTSAGLGWLTRS